MGAWGAWLDKQPFWVQMTVYTAWGGAVIYAGVRADLWWAIVVGALVIGIPVALRLRRLGEK
jgi:hypothetical protein